MLWRSRSSTPRRYPPGFIAPCLPTNAQAVPAGAQWIYEIKHDGFRFICRRDGERVYSCNGRDWTDRVPLIAEAIARLRVKSVTLDGENMRPYEWHVRRATLRSLIKRAGPGIRLSDHLDGDGVAAFRHACRMGLEGIVAKRRDKPYRSGRSPDWIKVKNPDAPAATRILE